MKITDIQRCDLLNTARVEIQSNPIMLRALKRLKMSKDLNTHVSHHTRHSSHSTRHSSSWAT